MQIYVVGGAVRDALMGKPVHDRDWVVVGSTPEAMVAQGYTPVGKDFPVFLHPHSREEYALARTERKTARGYKGFAVQAAPEVTLEEDLARRDLTVNAMAVPEALAHADPAEWAGHIVDPWGGQRDLHARVLRHVTPAFAEDPVRVLRLARLAARFADFRVADDTLALMRQMVQAGEIDHLVPERVWQEIARGLMSCQPSRLFEVLRACGALQVLLPEIDRLWGVAQRADHHPEIDTGVHAMMVIDMAARLQAPLTVRWAALMHDLGKGTTPAELLPRHIGHEGRSAKLAHNIADRLRVPSDCKELAEVVAREHGNIHRSGEWGAAALMRLLTRCDAIRQPERFARVLQACQADARGRLGSENSDYPQARRLAQALQAALGVNSADIAGAAAREGLRGPHIGQRVEAARTAAIAAVISAANAPSPPCPAPSETPPPDAPLRGHS
ncbi:MAG: multifunctional CCA addition/repair protein [Betaproteobacteria bacterium]|nr:multifunctional CCA addition/repair protein [Betaproteobacteria bacterium]